MFLAGIGILMFLFFAYIGCFIAYERKINSNLARKSAGGRSRARECFANELPVRLSIQDEVYDESGIKLEYVSSR